MRVNATSVLGTNLGYLYTGTDCIATDPLLGVCHSSLRAVHTQACHLMFGRRCHAEEVARTRNGGPPVPGHSFAQFEKRCVLIKKRAPFEADDDDENSDQRGVCIR